MTTKRKQSKATARAGINYIRSIVDKQNCVFQEIDLDNDIGNDAYIEFIDNEDATGCCIAVQIKSGESYVSSTGTHLVLKADKHHFEYWHSHILPVGAIVYDPQVGEAAWIDITAFLQTNSERINSGPYNISIPRSNTFGIDTFDAFRTHFLRYKESYKIESNFALALEKFANLEDAEGCLDAINSLFTFHRQRLASWYYLTSCFRNFAGHAALGYLVIALCHIPGHPDIYWHKGNVIEETVRRSALLVMKEHFDRADILVLLEAIDENGIARGTIGQCVHALIDITQNKEHILLSVAFDPMIAEALRYQALLLSIYYMQDSSPGRCINYITKYMQDFSGECDTAMLHQLKKIIGEHGGIMFY